MEKDSMAMRLTLSLLMWLITTNNTSITRICPLTETLKTEWKKNQDSTKTIKKSLIREKKIPFKSRLQESYRFAKRTEVNLEMLNSLQTTPLFIRTQLTLLTMLKTCLCLNGGDLRKSLKNQ
jgi:hypothetical protein